MKVSIGSKIVEGPWGGGNLFAKNLSEFLLDRGHEVVYDLSHQDIDIILLTDPRSRRESSSTFNHKDIKRYLKYINPNSVVIQRINECDERKGTKNINTFYKNASEVADHIVFVSNWLMEIYLSLGLEKEKCSVVLAGANKNIFNANGRVVSKNPNVLKFVTHHWSDHWNKGFDIYKKLDQLINKKNSQYRLEFTYIGNLPNDLNLKNTIHIRPLSGLDLAAEIKCHDIYITASINEPSGNHHIEASQCGLPVLYLNSGGIPEYCEGFGVSFTGLDDFEDGLNEIINNYLSYSKKMESYPFNSIKMCEEFYELFERKVAEKSKNSVQNKKNILKKPVLYSTKFFNFLTSKFNINKLVSVIEKIK